MSMTGQVTNEKIYEFAGWKLVDLVVWPSGPVDSRKVLAAAADGISSSCGVCGTHIKYAYIIEGPDGKKASVGSECIKAVIGGRDGDKLVAAIKSVADKAKREWERPHRQAELRTPELRAAIRANQEYEEYYLKGLLWRLDSDVNPWETYKELKQRIEPTLTWRKFTAEEKAAREAYVGEKIQTFIKAQGGR